MKPLLVFAVFFLSLGSAKAQPSKPYWVIETTVHNKNVTILRVYDSQNLLLHEVTMKGKALSVLSRRDRKRIEKKVKEILKHQAFASDKK